MLPQFFDMIGLNTQGLLFERIFWALLLSVGVVVTMREVAARRPLEDAWYGWAIGLGLGGFGAVQLFRALFQAELYFGGDGLHISNYGVAIAVAFAVGVTIAVREGRRSPAPPDVGHIFDLAFWILIFSMLGSRLLFIATEWREYYHLCVSPELVETSGGESDCFAVLKFWKGGLVFFGGFIGAALTGLVYCRRHQIDFFRGADIATPTLAIGHFLGRIGCLSAGCCFGRVTDSSLGIHMPIGSPAFDAQYNALLGSDSQLAHALVEQGQSALIHPTQLYEASTELVLFGFLLLLRARKRFHGQLLAVWLILYSIMRFVIEFYRGDTIRGFLFEVSIPTINRALGIAENEATLLSTSQAISIGLGLTGLLMYVVLRQKARAAEG